MLNKTAELAKKLLQLNIDFLQDLMTEIDETSDVENWQALCVARCLRLYIKNRLVDDSKKLYAEISDAK